MKKRLFWILTGVIGLIILILILAPGIGKRYVVSHSKKLLGRKIEIEKIKLNYFTTTVRIVGFKMYESDEKNIFASFDTLLVNLQPLNLIRSELVIEQLYLKGLYTQVIRTDSTFNFDDLLAFHTAKDSTRIEEPDSLQPKSLRFRFSNLELSKANFVLDDQNVGKTTKVRDLSFFIPLIAWDQEEKSEAGLKFLFAREGYFESSVKIDPIAGDFDADITINSLYLNVLKDYAATYMNIDSLDGKFSSYLHVTGNINKIEEAVVSGKIDILDFIMTDQQGQKFLGMKRLEIDLKRIDPYYSRYEIDSVILTEPYVHFVLSDTSNNFSEILDVSGGEEETAPSSGTDVDTISQDVADSLYYALNAFIIRQGMVDYTDNLTGEPFDYHLSEIVLNSDSITSDAGWVSLYAGMLLNNRGTLKSEVGFDPIDPMNNISLDYVITDFQLSDLNIYSRFYMGFPIIVGDMYYKSETQITEGALNSENKLVMTNVELGEKGGGLYDLPIKLALFILKDRYGVINLDVPVRGDLNDPQVKLGKIIWNTFKNLIVKVATSPFDALARSINADPKELESIEFGYMDTTLTASRQHQLDLLVDLEQKKEGLGIELVYFNDVDKEKEIIAGANKQISQEEIEALATLYSSSRVSVLANYLNLVSDSTQIKISRSNNEDPENTGSRPVFRIIYSLIEE